MRVRIPVPATSANLGPGFDVLGLALALHNEMAFEESDGVSVSIEGEGAGRLETGGDNVVVRGARMAFEAAGRPWKGVRLHCVNRIPPSRGLGSSAAAWVGGLVGGNALCGAPLDRDTLLSLAARAEGHPDNVTAALLGGLLCGAGMLIVFRHGASLGGLNIVVLYLQDRLGWRAGKVQMAMDGLIVLGALWVTDWQRVALSVLGAVVLNLALAINHRPGRYMAM